MREFYGKSRDELARYCAALELSPTHAERLFRGVYKQQLHASDIDGLPERLKQIAIEEFPSDSVRFTEAHESKYDHSVKFLSTLYDHQSVESVLMPEKRRITLCVSSQVGCAQACSFCHTGRMGLKRHLSAAEIVGQVMAANRWIKANPEWLAKTGTKNVKTISHIVFMGMGEPLDNVENVAHALEILCDPIGLDLPQRHISVSTAGHLDGLWQLLAKFPKIPVAISLHATTDRERSQLMPINRRWPLSELMSAVGRMNREFGNPVLIQYTVIRGVNDSEEQARALVETLQGLKVKVNLIPLNEIEPSRFAAPLPASLDRFRKIVHESGFRVMIRYSKGQDIAAACGQLVVNQ